MNNTVSNKPGRKKTLSESDKIEYQKQYYKQVLKQKRQYQKHNFKLQRESMVQPPIIKVVDKIIVYI